MLTAAEVAVQSGQGFFTVLILGLVVVGIACLAAKALFGRDDRGE